MDPRGERDGADRAARDVELADLTALRDHDPLAVRGPSVPGQRLIHRTQAFGDIHFDRIHRESLAAALEIANPERGSGTELFSFVADGSVRHLPGEREVPPIGRRLDRVPAAARAVILLLRMARGNLVGSAGHEIE